MNPTVTIASLAPAEAIGYLEKKGYQVTFDWRDMWQGEHARAFTVAKAMQRDILEDIRGAVDEALRDGITFSQFRERLTPTLQRKGWWGFHEMTDPLTGESKLVELGTPRRLRVIFDTNLRMARAAGRWERIERNKALLPYLVYKTRNDEVVRASHRPWHNLALPVDHEFWNTHYPPNGWQCRCVVTQVSRKMAEKNDYRLDEEPDINWRAWTNKRTGRRELVPESIDPGFAYNVGKAHMKGLTPPPRTGPLSTPRSLNKPADTPMPKARIVSRDLLLSSTVTSDLAIDAFLERFGAVRGRPHVFEDKLGEPVVISEEFFRFSDGTLKIHKSMRASEILLLADTIREPDEIWFAWEKIALDRQRTRFKWQLRRRYFARWRMPGEKREVDTLVAVDIGPDGWMGVTAFRPRGRNYLLNQRRGTLAYIRE